MPYPMRDLNEIQPAESFLLPLPGNGLERAGDHLVDALRQPRCQGFPQYLNLVLEICVDELAVGEGSGRERTAQPK